MHLVRSKSTRKLALRGVIAMSTMLAPASVVLLSPCPVIAAADEKVSAPAREAIDKGLEWLAKNQKPDGTFPQGQQAGTTAIPSLAVMAFLARGHVPGQGRYGEVINRSIDFVLQCQQPDGLLSSHQYGNHVMYEHGISTVMLAEVYGMVDDARRPKIGKALARSAAVILKAQKAPKGGDQQGGWRYQVNSPDSDMSVTGWQMMALRGAANCGAAIPRSALEAGRQYVLRSRSNDNTGGFGYQVHNGAKPTTTGTAVLMLELFRGLDPDIAPGEHPKAALGGGEYLIKNPPKNPQSEFYYYGVYYISQALNQLGGKYWDTVYPELVSTLLTQEQPDGTFAAPSGGQERDAGPAYRTAMACLALAVPYRYLPIYQNDN